MAPKRSVAVATAAATGSVTTREFTSSSPARVSAWKEPMRPSPMIPMRMRCVLLLAEGGSVLTAEDDPVPVVGGGGVRASGRMRAALAAEHGVRRGGPPWAWWEPTPTTVAPSPAAARTMPAPTL